MKTGFKVKKFSGRPVRDLVFDKVAMSTLLRLSELELLPPLDNTVIEELQTYLRAGPARCSYGWKRKFKARYFKLLREDPRYFEYPLPREEALGFVNHLLAALKHRERYLRSKKRFLYTWLNNFN